MTAYCSRCGEQFEAKGDWQRLCWECWRAAKDANEGASYDRGYSAGYRDGARSAARQTVTNGRTLDPDQLRSLIQLCHPDRHPPERAALANQVTAQLLNLLNP